MIYVDKGTSVYGCGRWTPSLHGMINVISKNTGEIFNENHDTLDWFNTNVKKLKDDRLKTLFKILAPIQWSGSSSIRSRQILVIERNKDVNMIYPFLTDTEKKLADQWRIENSYKGLWD